MVDIKELLSHELTQKSDEDKHKPRIFYGAGQVLKTYIDKYGFNSQDHICDSDEAKIGTFFCGVRIESISDVLAKEKKPKVIVSSVKYFHSIKDTLHATTKISDIDFFSHEIWPRGQCFMDEYKEMLQKNSEHFNWLYDQMQDTLSKQTMINVMKAHLTKRYVFFLEVMRETKALQYLERDIITLSPNEVFVDGGAFIGDTITNFIAETGNKFKRVYAFEPEAQNYAKLEAFKRYCTFNDSRILTLKKGLYDAEKDVPFMLSNESATMHQIVEEQESEQKIEVVALDEVIKEKVTLIKMDIEGSELLALKGARDLISRNKPKLAISIYHNPNDIIEIPKYILELCPEYRLYLRHYTSCPYDTVLYAV